MMPAPHARRIEGYAIVSADGMIANAAGIIPASLTFEADRQFFEHGIDGVDVVVHGRHSREGKPDSHLRHRLIVTRQIPAMAPDPSNDKSLLWNPAGASFEQALAAFGTSANRVGILGGTDVFGMFLDRYDAFHLSRAPDVQLPGGRPVFPGVPARTPEAILASHGLRPGVRQVLDPAAGLTVVSWERTSRPAGLS
jgi:riboflavin biosynthesis pyrimidine reductase